MRYLLRHCSTDRPAYLVAECTLAALAAAHAVVGLPVPARTFPIALHTLDSTCERRRKRFGVPISFIQSEAVRREDHGALPCQNCESSPLPSGWPCRATTREPKAAKPSAGGYSGWRWPQGGGVLRGVRWRDPLRDSAERPLGHGRDSLRHRSRGRHRHADRVRKAHRLRHQCDTEPFAGMSECEG